jgi:DNA-directed RNA polymerase subunit RPC12/RpoP
MGIFSNIFGSEGKNNLKNKNIANLKEIGEIDKCPYCKKTLEKIPSRKSKCPYCGEYMFSRTRPLDKKKVLVTENEKDEIELEWTRMHEANENTELLQNDEYARAKRDLAKQFAKEPSMNDVKWCVYNQRILTLSTGRQWGLYRNNKLDMVRLLKSERKQKQALQTLLEICYLDLNGCRNIGTINGKPVPKEMSDKLGIRDFDISMAFLAPGILSMIEDNMRELDLDITEVGKMFVETNNNTKPLRNMPLNPEQAWKKLLNEIKSNIN